MPQQSETRLEAASALIQGSRDHQEDAVIADFPLGSDMGMVVLADGMGGHAAGDVASKIVMTEVYSELKFQSTDPGVFSTHLPDILMNAAQSANDCILAHVDGSPESYGMGATLVAAVVLDKRLHWISVGDSPLYLFRGDELIQLNEDHSMAPQIDLMVAKGMMTVEAAAHHPDRNALTSVLSGDEIPKIDCPTGGFPLADGDIILVSSDGLQFLENHEIQAVLQANSEKSGTAIAQKFLDCIDDLNDPDQDNTSLAVIKVEISDVAKPASAKPGSTYVAVSAGTDHANVDNVGSSVAFGGKDEDDEVVVETLPLRRAEAAPTVAQLRMTGDASSVHIAKAEAKS